MLMDKVGRSSSSRLWIFALALWFCAAVADAITLSPEQARRIGHKVWQNECNGTIAGLTSWNEGEDFASLGIGHFIWYPAGKRGPFEESFPKFLSFARAQHVDLPPSLQRAGVCPWNSRAEFSQAGDSSQMRELRQFLARTVDLQTQFLIARLEESLPKMLDESEPEIRNHVRKQFERLAATPSGCYALIDYVNFKGEGVLHTERYNGQGWGLLQVLETMRPNESDAVREFSRAAMSILRRRVANSPPARHESRWLSGWLNRVNSYTRG
jgi:hypothetical protein